MTLGYFNVARRSMHSSGCILAHILNFFSTVKQCRQSRYAQFVAHDQILFTINKQKPKQLPSHRTNLYTVICLNLNEHFMPEVQPVMKVALLHEHYIDVDRWPWPTKTAASDATKTWIVASAG